MNNSKAGGLVTPSAVSISLRMVALLTIAGPSRPPKLAGTLSPADDDADDGVGGIDDDREDEVVVVDVIVVFFV